jgi:iron-sulfur cluster assembly protein
MIKVTPDAAKQILKSFENDEKSILRVAVQQKPDGDFHYIMGLDEAKAGDTRFISNEIKIAVADEHVALLDKMEIDYVEINPDEYNFIFKNPNDPKFKQESN